MKMAQISQQISKGSNPKAAVAAVAARDVGARFHHWREIDIEARQSSDVMSRR